MKKLFKIMFCDDKYSEQIFATSSTVLVVVCILKSIFGW